MLYSPKDFYKKILGKVGEKKAAKYLKRKGYKILETNFSIGIGEIDIIAQDKKTLVFIEVKTRSTDAFGRPSDAVDKLKRAKYVKVAQAYLIKNYGKTDVLSRFDVIEIENGQINHVENAFFA